MNRILLRAGKSPFDVIDPVSALEDYPAGVFGKNVGNLVFSDSMHRILSTPGAEIVPNTFLSERAGVTGAYSDRINESFDHFVIPLANAFRTSFLENLDVMTQVIEQLTIPVTVVGVGVQGGGGSLERPLDDVPDELKRAVKRFVNAVLERSATIGVRGENTRALLAGLGYGDDKVDVIGCPSLYRYGGDLRVEKKVPRLTVNSPISMNVSPYVGYMNDISAAQARKYRNLIYIPQDVETLRLLIWGTNPEKFAKRAPTHDGHPLYTEDRIRFFVDSRTWIDELRSRVFSFGTRIHGNIAALIAGTPAFVLVHDTRTQELAQFHEIPHRLVPELSTRVDAARLYEEADYTAFNAGHRARFENFVAFLDRNRVPHVFTPGNENPDYDELLEALPLPGPVRRIPDGQEDLVMRMRWLYGRLPAKRQDSFRFRAPFPHLKPTTPQQQAGLLASTFGRKRRTRG
ncbi:MAG: polysaccharide pyruvyl transferase family protein [Microbacteriaceae bacterium]